MRAVHCVHVLAFVVAARAASIARADQPLTIDDAVAIRRLQAVQISPQADRVAYVLEVPQDELHSKLPAAVQLWIVPTAGGEPRLLTQAVHRDSAPQWSPDGRRIAFLSSRDGDVPGQFYAIDPDGTGERRLAVHPDPVQSFTWSPDGERIAFVAPVDPRREADEQRLHDLGYDAFEVEPSETVQRPRASGLWMLEVASGKTRLVDTGPGHVVAAQWSPDGNHILLTIADSTYSDDVQLRPRLATVGPEGGTPVVYCPTRGKLLGPAWSPDAGAVAFLGSTFEDTDFFPNGCFVARERSAPQDVAPRSSFAVEKFRWLPDGRSLLATAMQGCHRYLARIDLADGTTTPLTEAPWEISWRSDFSVAADGRIACVLAQSTMPPEVWTIDPAGEVRRLTNLNPALAERTFGQGEEVRWQSPDGWEIAGLLIKPVGYRPGERYPLIVQLHGSNMGDAADFHVTPMHWGQLLAARGYAVLLPNYRGSLTGSVEFRRGARGDFGGRDLADILSGVDALVDRGIADPDRLGICGVSYGGYLTARAITQTTRFKAAAMASGIANWFSLHSGQTGAPESAIRLEWDLSPYRNRDLLWDRSPVAHLDAVRTPTLLFWGENDVIPISQAVELHRGLRTFGVPSELVVYPREGHVVAEPNHLRDQYGRLLAWFDERVRGVASSGE